MDYAIFTAILIVVAFVSWAIGVKVGAHATVKRIAEEMDK
jgi:hypothetical protein